jgi:hypothetical protein
MLFVITVLVMIVAFVIGWNVADDVIGCKAAGKSAAACIIEPQSK